MSRKGNRKRQPHPRATVKTDTSRPSVSAKTGGGTSDSLESLAEIFRKYGVAIFALLALVYLLSFIARPLPDITQTIDGEIVAVPRISLIQMLFRSMWSDYWDQWTGGGLEIGFLADRAPILAVSTVWIALAALLGYAMLRALGMVGQLTRLESFALSVGMGLGLMSLILLTCGLIGAFHLVAFFTGYVVLLAICGAYVLFPRHRKQEPTTDAQAFEVLEEKPSDEDRYSRLLRRIAIVGSFGFGLIIVAGAMLPPRDFDVLEYHLQVPKEWLQQGRLSFLDHNVYGNMPLGSELHAIGGMLLLGGQDQWLKGALVGKTVMAVFLLLAAILIYGAGKRWATPTAGALSSLVFLSIPWMIRTGFTGWNEGAYAFYLLASWFVVMVVLGYRTASQRLPWNGLLAAGLFAGTAIACKYPALLFVALPLGLLILFAPKVSEQMEKWGFENRSQCTDPKTPHKAGPAAWLTRQSVICLLIFTLGAAVASGPWFAKNVFFTGNPTYPLLSSWFGTRTEAQNEQWRAAHSMKAGTNAFTPGRFVSDIDAALVGSQWLSPILIPFAIAAFAVRRSRVVMLVILALLVFHFLVWWLLTHRIERFLIPTYPLVAIMAGVGLTATRRLPFRILACSALAISCVLSLQLALAPKPILGDSRILATDERLAQVDEPTYVMHRYINETVPADGKVLLVGDAAPFYLEVPFLYNTCFDDCRFEMLLRDKSTAERRKALREEGITHVFVYWSEINRYRATYGFSDFVTPAVVQELIDQNLLRPVPSPLNPSTGEFFEVVRL